MALTNSENTSTGSVKYLKLEAEAGPTSIKPYFVEKIKNEDGSYGIGTERYTKVSGVIESVRTTHNGKTGIKEVKGFSIKMKDKDETYFIDSTMKNASKDLANMALASIGLEVQFDVYLNKNGYPTSFGKTLDGTKLDGQLPYPLDGKVLWEEIKKQEPRKDADEGISVSDIPF